MYEEELSEMRGFECRVERSKQNIAPPNRYTPKPQKYNQHPLNRMKVFDRHLFLCVS